MEEQSVVRRDRQLAADGRDRDHRLHPRKQLAHGGARLALVLLVGRLGRRGGSALGRAPRPAAYHPLGRAPRSGRPVWGAVAGCHGLLGWRGRLGYGGILGRLGGCLGYGGWLRLVGWLRRLLPLWLRLWLRLVVVEQAPLLRLAVRTWLGLGIGLGLELG